MERRSARKLAFFHLVGLMKLGRNSPCICGSGKKFKHCCAKVFQEVRYQTVVEPFIQVPLTLHATVIVGAMHEENTPPFWPICVIGKQWSDIQFSANGADMEGSQLVRLGFVNREFRLLAQVRTNKGVFEVSDNAVLPDGMHQIVVTFGPAEVTLFVDSVKVASNPMDGQFDCNFNESVSFGHGGGGGIAYVVVYRRGLTATEVESLLPMKPPANLQNWTEDKFGFSRLFTDHEFDDVASVWFSRGILRAFRGESLSSRVLTLAGDSESNYQSPQLASNAAGKRITDVVEQLMSIINDESKTERDLLAYFKSSPEAAILLNSDAVKIWREESIQDYGQIDFVLELVDGTHEVVEIESHGCQIFTAKDEPTQEVQHAVNQVDRWITGASKSPTRIFNRFDVTGGECFTGSVVIGRSSEINSLRRRENWHTLKRKSKIGTWDDILRRGQLLAARLSNPVISQTQWQ